MRNKIINFVFIVIFICLSGPIKSYAQIIDNNYEISYILKYSFFKNSGVIRTVPCKLYVNREKSLFGEDVFFKYAKIDYIDAPASEKMDQKKGLGLPKFRFYIEKMGDKVLNIEQIVFKEFVASEEKAEDINRWEIVNETDSIAGLEAQRAEVDYGGRHWIAWFSTEIPISDGPYKFSGLPGLIVKLESEEGDYVFEIQGIKEVESSFEFPFVPPFKMVSKEKLLELRVNNYENPYAYGRSSGGTISSLKIQGKLVTEEEVLQMLKDDRMKFNTIEYPSYPDWYFKD